MVASLLLSGLLSLLTTGASAQTNAFDAAACMRTVEQAMGREQRLYRSVITGQPTAKESPVNSVRYDKDNALWIKTNDDTWEKFNKENDGNGDSQSDSRMDSSAEFPARRGWLEVREAETSELIPPILQSYRALTCRINTVCAVAIGSINAKKDADIKIQVRGCEEVSMKALASCVVEGEERPPGASVSAFEIQCNDIGSALLNREQEMLKFLIAYDAAVRSIYQFLGIIDTFLTEMQSTLLGPIWQTVRSFQAFERIPCFSSQCEQ